MSASGWPCLAPQPVWAASVGDAQGRRSENWATGTSGLHNPTLFQAARVPPPLLFVTACWLTRGDIFMKWVIITVINWILHWVTSRFTKNVPYSHISPPHQPPRAKISPLCKYGDLYHLYLGVIVPRSSSTAPYTVTEGLFRVAAYYNNLISIKFRICMQWLAHLLYFGLTLH